MFAGQQRYEPGRAKHPSSSKQGRAHYWVCPYDFKKRSEFHVEVERRQGQSRPQLWGSHLSQEEEAKVSAEQSSGAEGTLAKRIKAGHTQKKQNTAIT